MGQQNEQTSQSAQHTPPRYEITADGRVLVATDGMRELAQELNFHGYPSVRILVGGKRKRMLVHSLVARTHLGPQPAPGYEVRHLDGNRQNNHYKNLAWGTRKENAADREAHGRTYRMSSDEARAKAECAGHVKRARAAKATGSES